MNQQNLISSLSAYPAPKASDMWLWYELGFGLDIPRADEDEMRTLMSARVEKILLTTRHSWAKKN